MKGFFTDHIDASEKGWLGHTKFALGVAARLFIASACFVLHGLFPFIPIPGSYNFEYMIQYLKNKNQDVSK